MADVDLMRGLEAIDQVIRDSVIKGGEPGAGLYLLLDMLATTQLGANRSAFPAAPPPEGDNPLGAPLESSPQARATDDGFKPWRG